MSAESKVGQAGGNELAPRPERPKTKIDAVREQLQANPNVFFAGEVHHYHEGAPEYGYWTETVDMVIAPTAPQFDADKLNIFMDSLITDVELSARDAAYNQDEGGIHLGKLYYDEAIGTLRRVTNITIETTEPDIIQRAGRIVGESQSEWQRTIQRRTWVRVYPDPTSAGIVYNYENGVVSGTVEPNSLHDYAQHWLNGEQVRNLKAQYNRNPISRIIGILQRGK